jgi:hypothetical protein
MTYRPGEGGDFEFNLEVPQAVDPEVLAEYVLWPMVDSYWRGDWREVSALTDNLEVRKLGSIEGQQYDVGLFASNDVWEVDEDTETGLGKLATVVIDVQTLVTDGRRDVLLSSAREDIGKRIENGRMLNDETIELLDEDMDPDDLCFKVAATYSIDTDGDVEIDIDQSIEDVTGNIIWYKEPSSDENDADDNEDDPDDEESTKIIYPRPIQAIIMEHDLELIEYGVRVLDPTQAVLRALRELRG